MRIILSKLNAVISRRGNGRLNELVRPFGVNKMSATIEEIAILNGICPLCLGTGLLPRDKPMTLCTFCLGSSKINITKEKGEDIMEAILKRSQDSSCSL